jgi:pimeloyl-ACP methyl ester carboxylesterase
MRIRVGDVEIGYERAGAGEPVILVMGLGFPRIGWFRQFGELSKSYDVTIFDNRGVGETVSSGSWTIEDMAGDTIGLADAFGLQRFHLAGISMGGMISQEIVLRYPDRVRSLTLLATSPGGPEAVPLTPQYLQALMLPDPVQRARRSVELIFGDKFRRENPDSMEVILQAVTSGAAGGSPVGAIGPDGGAGFAEQVSAIAAWMSAGGSASRLSGVRVPTLVLHGGDDNLLPLPNGKLLARDIPGARIRVWDDAGHALNAEYPDEVNAELVQHFEGAAVTA